ncbi:MAG: lipase maturation factor family protein [Verrucomicrobiota bacterium]
MSLRFALLNWVKSTLLHSKHHYPITTWLFIRGLALIYLLAISSMWLQIDGLIGSDGILPAHLFFDRVWQALDLEGLWFYPSLLWISCHDSSLHLLCLMGTVLALLAFIGFAEGYIFAVLWAIYLSLTIAGQTFWGFQWDNLLLETGIVALFICHWHAKPSKVVNHPYHLGGIWLLRCLLFKLMFLSGVVKLASQDEVWWNLTALEYHFFTQPLPPFTAWYMHHAPTFLLKVSTFIMFIIELVLPFLIFAPRKWRLIPFGSFVLLMLLITVTGNYGFFNYLTALLCISLLDDSMLPRKIRQTLGTLDAKASFYTVCEPKPKIWNHTLTAFACLLFLFNLIVFANASPWRNPLASGFQDILRPLSGFRSINNYGLFANMTEKRPEIIIEGSHDGNTWKAYEFYWKPGKPDKLPAFIAPYHPRLDWQMWFAALGNLDHNPWLTNLMIRMLQNKEQAERLLKYNPFPEAPPQFIRAQLYHYEFTSPEEKIEQGDWWKRKHLGAYSPTITQQFIKR